MKTITYDETEFVLVPRLPDAEMLDAAINTHFGFKSESEVDDVWTAMLAVAPSEGEMS